MSARSLLFLQLIAVLILSAIHVYGTAHFWYWEWRWLDTVTHFLGGVSVGFFVLWAGALFERKAPLILCLAVGLLFGIGWEMFEIGIGAMSFPADALDTFQDLGMDLLGTACAWLFVAGISRLSVKE